MVYANCEIFMLVWFQTWMFDTLPRTDHMSVIVTLWLIYLQVACTLFGLKRWHNISGRSNEMTNTTAHKKWRVTIVNSHHQMFYRRFIHASLITHRLRVQLINRNIFTIGTNKDDPRNMPMKSNPKQNDPNINAAYSKIWMNGIPIHVLYLCTLLVSTSHMISRFYLYFRAIQLICDENTFKHVFSSTMLHLKVNTLTKGTQGRGHPYPLTNPCNVRTSID